MVLIDNLGDTKEQVEAFQPHIRLFLLLYCTVCARAVVVAQQKSARLETESSWVQIRPGVRLFSSLLSLTIGVSLTRCLTKVQHC